MIKFWDSRHTQLAIYRVLDEESESEVKNCQIWEPGGKKWEKPKIISNDYVLLFSLCELYQINATIIFNNIKYPIYIKFGSQIDILIRINI